MNKKYIYRWTAKAADWSTYKMCYELAKTERGALVAAHRWCDDNLLHGMGADHIAIVRRRHIWSVARGEGAKASSLRWTVD